MSELTKITPYQCRYEKMLTGSGLMGDSCVLLTPRDKLAELINSDWKYSWHWKEDHNEWVAQVSGNLNDELERAKKRLRDLECASRILQSIELENKTE